jgi:hypothetical protein
MNRLLFGVAFAAVGLAVALLPGSVAAEVSPLPTTQVILSCTDGHSVMFQADPATLSSVTAAVQAINASSGATSCAMDTSAAGPSSGTAKWTVYDYNASGKEIAPRNSPGSMPATTAGTTTMFNFLPDHYTALLTTNDRSLTGDLSTTTLTDQIALSGPAATFETQFGGGVTALAARPLRSGSSSCRRPHQVGAPRNAASIPSSGGRTRSTSICSPAINPE